MKLFSLLLVLISITSIAQPGDSPYPEPCDGYENIYLDINADGENDIMMYMGAEGTDDVPSSYGFCQYRLAIMNGGIIDAGQESVFIEANTIIVRSEIEYKSLQEFSSGPIQEFPYGTAASDYEPTQRDPTEYNFIPYWMIDESDTLTGWISVYIGGADEIPSFHKWILSENEHMIVGEYPPPSGKFADVGWSSGLNLGSYINFTNADPGLIGGRINYYFQYGILNPSWYIGYFQTEIGVEAIPTLNRMAFGPVWTNKVHFTLFDVGFSTGYYPNVGDGLILTRWEVGVSMKNLQLMIYGPLGNSAYNELPGGNVTGLMLNYTIPVTGLATKDPSRVFVH